MEEEFIEEESGVLSVGDFFKVIFNKKWIVLAVTVAALLLGMLLTVFVINPAKLCYQVCFSMEYPAKSSAYPDGKPFRFQDMVSLEYLQAVKASDERFAGLDVNAISQKDGITIYNTAVTDLSATDAQSGNPKPCEYKFVAKAKYFPDKGTANEFLHALAAYPAEYAKASLGNVDFKKDLQSYGSESVKRYEERLKVLNNEYEFLVRQYNELAAVFGESFIINQKPVSVWINELNMVFNSNDMKTLSANLKMYGYLFDDQKLFSESNNDLVFELQSNTKKRQEVEKTFGGVIPSGAIGDSPVYETLQNLILRNEEIKNILEFRGVEYDDTTTVWTWKQKADPTAYNNFVAKSNEFGAKLDGIKTKLEGQADICKSVMASACGQRARVIILNNQPEKLNETSLVLAAAMSLLIGFVAVAAIVLIIDMPAYARKKRQALEAEYGNMPDDGRDEQPVVGAEDNGDKPQ